MSAPTVPQLDAAGGRLTLSRRLMPIALQLQSGSDSGLGQPDTTVLETAGILVAGRLHPVADAILETMTNPDLVASIEVTTVGLPPWVGTVWGLGAIGVVGESPAPDMFTLHQTQRGLLPFHVAHLVGVGPRPTPSSRLPVVVDANVLAASRPHWHAPVVMSSLLTAQRVPQQAARALAQAHASRRASWRLTCLRTDPAGIAAGSETSMLDGGEAGYWKLATDADAAGTVTFTPIPWPLVIDLVGDLLPTG